MPVNERGEFIRAEPMPERADDSVQNLISTWEALIVQSAHPTDCDQPNDLLFWAGARLEHNIRVFDEMKSIAEHSHITQITVPYSTQVISLAEFYAKVRRSSGVHASGSH